MNKVITLCIVASFALIACKKKGCIDPTAVNYSTEAEKDDGTCTYNGYAVFWFNSVAATNMVNASIPNLDFYIDGVQIGSVSVTQFSIAAPLCGGSDGYTTSITLDSQDVSVSKSYSIKKSGTSTVLQSGTVLFTSTPCHWIELNY